MKTRINFNLAVIIFGIIFIAASCTEETELLPKTSESSDELVNLKSEESPTNTLKTINDEEIASLIFMVEEEKLAYDVYAQMFQLYGLKIFENISESEGRHVAAVSRLIDKYGLENPALINPEGVFVNEELQSFYNELIETGMLSKNEAINAGVLFETEDIADLQAYLNNVIVSEDIRKVYTSLLNAASRHLEVFTGESN